MKGFRIMVEWGNAVIEGGRLSCRITA